MTRRILALALAFALGIPSATRAQSTCDAAFSDSLARRDLDALERVAAVPPIWNGYTLANHPLLLIADTIHRGAPATPVCAAIWRAHKPLQILELASRPKFSTPLYALINLDSIGSRANAASMAGAFPPVEPAVAARLREAGVTRVVALNVPLNYERLGRFGEMMKTMGANPSLLNADLAVHESFHLHSQFPTWLDQSRTYDWPAWDHQPDRKELRERCYAGTPAITQAHEQEMAALLAAFDAVHADSAQRDVAAGIRHARRFVELRAARRALQDTMTVGQRDRRISCALAEDVMELEEGSGQWIGHASTVRAGLTTLARLRASYGAPQPEHFYRSGPLQLWVLYGLLGEERMQRVVTSIARSVTPEGANGGIFSQFEHVVTATGPAPAQHQDSTALINAALADAVAENRQVRVHSGGPTVTGRVRLLPSETFQVGGRSFSFSDVRALEVRFSRADPVWNGILIGSGVGTVVIGGFFVMFAKGMAEAPLTSRELVPMYFWGAVLGAGGGLALDAIEEPEPEWRSVYSRP